MDEPPPGSSSALSRPPPMLELRLVVLLLAGWLLLVAPLTVVAVGLTAVRAVCTAVIVASSQMVQDVRAWHREHAETVALTLIGRQGDLLVLHTTCVVLWTAGWLAAVLLEPQLRPPTPHRPPPMPGDSEGPNAEGRATAPDPDPAGPPPSPAPGRQRGWRVLGEAGPWLLLGAAALVLPYLAGLAASATCAGTLYLVAPEPALLPALRRPPLLPHETWAVGVIGLRVWLHLAAAHPGWFAAPWALYCRLAFLRPRTPAWAVLFRNVLGPAAATVGLFLALPPQSLV